MEITIGEWKGNALEDSEASGQRLGDASVGTGFAKATELVAKGADLLVEKMIMFHREALAKKRGVDSVAWPTLH